jgi:hypothetical protein
MGYNLCGARPSRVKAVWPTWALWPRTKQGSPPPHFPPTRGSSAELSVRVPIWGIGSAGAHRGGLVAMKQVGCGVPVTAGQRRGGGHRLGVRGAVVSSSRGCCGGEGARRWCSSGRWPQQMKEAIGSVLQCILAEDSGSVVGLAWLIGA